MAAFDVMDHGMPCAFCTRDLSGDEKERVFLLHCCMSAAHHACLREKFPDCHLVTCPKCRSRTRVTAQVLRRDKFSPEESDKIEYCFLKHHAASRIPMTSEEIQVVRIAMNVRGFRAMRHVSHRVFAVGLAFWFPLPKEKLCEWEDIALGLTLGLTWNMVSKMRTRYDLRVKRDGKGDDFHHFVDYLLDVCVEDDDLVSRACVVRSCSKCDSECEECKAFATIFDGERQSRFVAMANRGYFTSASRRRCLRSSRG